MRNIIAIASLFAVVLPTTAAIANSEIDRLREALRTATAQTRGLEDQRTALQAKLAKSEQDNAAIKAQADAAKAHAKQVEKDYRQAVTEFNDRLEERNQTLEKWKEAYTEAATVARTKEMERAALEGEANSLKQSNKVCTAKNQQLVKVGRELLVQYEGVTLGDALLAREPVTGIRRAQIKTLLEDYSEKILEQKAQR